MTATMRGADADATVGHRRLLPGSLPTLAEHARIHGPLPRAGDHLIGRIGEAGLTGRGGAAFPTARKLTVVAGQGRRPVVVANGAEGEPASEKDRALLLHGPHLVLDGLQLVAEAVGAGRAIAYVPRAAGDRLADQLAQRRAAGWDRLPVEIVVAPHAFIAGEESAVVSAIEGGPARPRDKRQLVLTKGVRGAPTLVQNVETLAHVALIARHGPAWFRAAGTVHEPGTFLATVNGSVATPGVYELPLGLSLRALLAGAGGPTAPLQAVLIGGYHGGWVPPNPELPLSGAALRPYGAAPGAGVVLALPDHACGLAESARIARYLADQSAGQCGPCRNGLPHLADTLAALAQPTHATRRELAAEVARMTSIVTGRGACHHPDGTARFIRSALHAFSSEVELHLSGRCRAR
jgi:NADH:ubiquinone oxidoreductase subunit F (NADH-binding)